MSNIDNKMSLGRDCMALLVIMSPKDIRKEQFNGIVLTWSIYKNNSLIGDITKCIKKVTII